MICLTHLSLPSVSWRPSGPSAGGAEMPAPTDSTVDSPVAISPLSFILLMRAHTPERDRLSFFAIAAGPSAG